MLARYALRNAILPQITTLAIALGQVVSGAVLVEVVFGLPGIGSLLYKAKLRHAGHHAGRYGNFGVTTGFWDRVLGTIIARDAAR